MDTTTDEDMVLEKWFPKTVSEDRWTPFLGPRGLEKKYSSFLRNSSIGTFDGSFAGCFVIDKETTENCLESLEKIHGHPLFQEFLGSFSCDEHTTELVFSGILLPLEECLIKEDFLGVNFQKERILVQVAEALLYSFSVGVYHPLLASRVFLTAEGDVRLVDYYCVQDHGFSCWYMSPQTENEMESLLFREENIVYSFGMLAFFLLSLVSERELNASYGLDHFSSYYRLIRQNPLRVPDICGKYCHLIRMCLDHKPAERPRLAHVLEMVQDLMREE